MSENIYEKNEIAEYWCSIHNFSQPCPLCLQEKITESGRQALADLMIKSHSPLTKDETEQAILWAREIARTEVNKVYEVLNSKDRRFWESMHLGSWAFDAKYQRETIAKMVRRGEISEACAEDMLHEVANGDHFKGPHILTDKDGNKARCCGNPAGCEWCAKGIPSNAD